MVDHVNIEPLVRISLGFAQLRGERNVGENEGLVLVLRTGSVPTGDN